MTPRVAIIGGGLAGLTAAHCLLQRGVEVTVIDKGRHGGGRMCTRTIDLPDGRVAKFDLGPPVLYPRLGYDRAMPAHRVTDLASELPGTGLFQRRLVGRIGAAGEAAGYGEITGLTATGGMRELAFRLLAGHPDTLEFHDYTLAEQLERTEDGWRVHIRSLRDGSERIVSANGLILTPPIPQTLDLLQKNNITLPDNLRDDLRAVTYSRCIAVYGMFTGSDPLQPGGVWFGDGPLEWIADNQRKDVSPVGPAITALTTSDWATEHWKDPDTRVLELLLPRLESWVGTPVDPQSVCVHRWKWAQALTPILASCAVLRDLATVIAGDGFAGTVSDRADAAVASGEDAAARMAALLTALVRQDARYSVAAPRRCTLEIAVSNPEEARLAEIYGADRLELSVGLEIGGRTPSMGLFRAVRERVKLPIYVLLRPRAGGFAYSPREYAVMQEDAEAFLAEGANGIVFAALTFGGQIDQARCRELVKLANGKAVFHRAFDFLPNPTVVLEELISLGFERVLTSGGASTAETGTNCLAALVQHAGWQIEVLPAGNIRPHNVADLVRATRCDQVHAACRVPVEDPVLARHPRLASGMGAPGEMNSDLVRGLRRQLDQLAESL